MEEISSFLLKTLRMLTKKKKEKEEEDVKERTIQFLFLETKSKCTSH